MYPVLVVRRTTGNWTNGWIHFVTGTSDVITSVSSGGKGKNLKYTSFDDVRILTVITVKIQVK
jgi:hypothetical protein